MSKIWRVHVLSIWKLFLFHQKKYSYNKSFNFKDPKNNVQYHYLYAWITQDTFYHLNIQNLWEILWFWQMSLQNFIFNPRKKYNFNEFDHFKGPEYTVKYIWVYAEIIFVFIYLSLNPQLPYVYELFSVSLWPGLKWSRVELVQEAPKCKQTWANQSIARNLTSRLMWRIRIKIR